MAEKRFRIVVAGCGGMSSAWLKYAAGRNDVEIAGLVDISAENANDKKQKFNLGCPVFAKIADALREARPNLVFDVTVPDAHFEVASAAMKHGCDVLSEKPMAGNLKDAYKLVGLSDKTGRTYAIMQNRRYMKNIRSMNEIVSKRMIGDLSMVCADFFIGAHFGGFRDLMESPLVLDMAIHTFDQARFISGLGAKSAYCQEFNLKGSWYRGDASAVCIFEMDGGTIFCYRGSWSAEGMNTTWEADWKFFGTNGAAAWDGKAFPTYVTIKDPAQKSFIRETTQPAEHRSEWNGQEGHNGCFDEMFSALIEGRKPETDCHDNIKSMEMVFKAIESSRKGKKIQIVTRPR